MVKIMNNTTCCCSLCDSCPARSSSELLDFCAECTDEKADKEAFQKELEAYRRSWEIRINSGL